MLRSRWLEAGDRVEISFSIRGKPRAMSESRCVPNNPPHARMPWDLNVGAPVQVQLLIQAKVWEFNSD
ncbi:MAG: hypothetical protein DWI22_14040 [Planctomycetota bacterium]|nr:hypothetical protein [Planctomycetales bacterium]RLT05422.1 MAG: hypothetical protein DWI22_14040 [Planctomycetota bacterium]